MDEEKNLQVNVNFDNTPGLYEDLKKMVADDMTDRSKFIKKLIAQEKARRAQLELPLGMPAKKSTRKAVAA